MAIYRGPGGSGDAIADSANTAQVTETFATQAGVSAAAAASSATDANAAKVAAEAAQTAAEAAQTAAELAETNAETAETNAETALTAALAAQTAAETAQTAAELAETNAETAETGALAAQSAAEAAQLAAENAQTAAELAETNAETAETNAASSASAAASSASAALTSENNAATSETNAASSASAAAGSASAAATSETNAASSASAASTSESNAATSESNAATSASNASTSASNAATSETNAANSATAASNSASAAATSESNAAASAAAAATALDNFDDRYLGSKTSDPTVDNDGDALIAGALYFNSVDGAMRVYTGSVWVDAYAAGTSFLAKVNNLSDLPNASTARTNLGLAIGVDVQAYDVSILKSGDIGVTVQGYDADTAKYDDVNPTFTDTGAIKIPVGTEAQRPGTPAAGQLRFNNDSDEFEGYDGTAWGAIGSGGGGGGDVTGPASSTDNAIARFDSTTGKIIQNSGITIDDSNVFLGATQINVDNLRLDGNTVSSTNSNGNIVLAPNGSGDVQVDADTLRVGDSGVDATIQSNGNADLILKTGNATTGSVTLADGANGNLTVALNGTGQIIVNAGAVGTPTIAPTGDTNTGIFFPAADTIAFAEGGAEAMRIDSSGNLLFNSGYGSVATAYGCRAWVNFNGTGTVAIRASRNVSSITDNGTGDYTINFTNAMPDINYAAASYAHNNSDNSAWIRFVSGPANSVPKTTTTFRITSLNVAWNAVDTNQIDVSIFR